MLPEGVGRSGGGGSRSRRVVLILCDLGMAVSDPALNHSTSRNTSQGRKTEEKEVRGKQVNSVGTLVWNQWYRVLAVGCMQCVVLLGRAGGQE